MKALGHTTEVRPGKGLSFFDIIPEHLAAQEFRKIAPHAVTLVRQLQRKPQCKFIVFGIGVAQKQGVPCLRGLRLLRHTSSLVLADAALQGWHFAFMAA